MRIDVACDTPDILGESPVWSVAEQALYWIDVRAPALHRLTPGNGRIESWPLPEVVGSAVLRASGGLVLALRSGLFAFDPASGALSLLLPVDEGHEGNRLNDAKVDRRGNLWFSTMWDFGLHATGALYRLDAGLRLETVRQGVRVPNAICFSPEGGTAYFADTPTRRIEAAPVGSSGLVGPWRVLDAGEGVPGNPDGATVDAEGFVWNARYGGGAIARYAPDGRLDRVVALPVGQPSACAFGGPDLATLYVTTARQKLSPQDLAAQPLAGCLLALRPGVAGLPERGFGG
jgi:sugar lactone lactonase YvrE